MLPVRYLALGPLQCLSKYDHENLCTECEIGHTDLYFAILCSCSQHLCVSAETHAQHGVVHHHEVVLCLVLQIL